MGMSLYVLKIRVLSYLSHFCQNRIVHKIWISAHTYCTTHKQKFLSAHRLFVLFPAVIISCHCNTSITQPGLLGKNHLRYCGHVDDISTPLSEHEALCPRRETRTLYGHHCPSVVTLHTESLGNLHEHLQEE